MAKRYQELINQINNYLQEKPSDIDETGKLTQEGFNESVKKVREKIEGRLHEISKAFRSTNED